MIEVQKTDGSFVLLNTDTIVTIESNKKKEVTDELGRTYTVNDFGNGTEFTIELINGKSIQVTKLGLALISKASTRAVFDPIYHKDVMKYV